MFRIRRAITEYVFDLCYAAQRWTIVFDLRYAALDWCRAMRHSAGPIRRILTKCSSAMQHSTGPLSSAMSHSVGQ
jgi:hypothetical protein